MYINKSLEGNPFIIRFKTDDIEPIMYINQSLEGNPFIIRFKTFKIQIQRHSQFI